MLLKRITMQTMAFMHGNITLLHLLVIENDMYICNLCI